jgi:hypothetical protein
LDQAIIANLSTEWIGEFAQVQTEVNGNGEKIYTDGLGEYWWRVLGVITFDPSHIEGQFLSNHIIFSVPDKSMS